MNRSLVFSLFATLTSFRNTHEQTYSWANESFSLSFWFVSGISFVWALGIEMKNIRAHYCVNNGNIIEEKEDEEEEAEEKNKSVMSLNTPENTSIDRCVENGILVK